MPRQAKVVLGGREYTIVTPPIRASKAWRESLARPFGSLTAALETAGSVELDVRQLTDIAGMVRNFSGVLIGSIDTMLELLFQYSPVLAQDREWIEENAYDEEALEAFTATIKLAYPLEILREIISGPSASKTSSNSPSPNGVSGKKKTPTANLPTKHRG